MQTPKDSAAFFPRVPAIYDSELPSAAALLVRCVRMADRMHGQAQDSGIITAIWNAAAPAVKAQPFACASLIDAMNDRE